MIIGGDETGKGEYWGPLVVAVACASEIGAEAIAGNSNVKDSKKLAKDRSPSGRDRLRKTSEFIRQHASRVEVEVVKPGYIADHPPRSLNGILLEAFENCILSP